MSKQCWKAALLPAVGMVFLFQVSSYAQAQRPPGGGSYPGLTYDKIRRAVRDIESKGDDFKKSLRRALNTSVLDGSNREDELNRQARRLESAADRIKKE